MFPLFSISDAPLIGIGNISLSKTDLKNICIEEFDKLPPNAQEAFCRQLIQTNSSRNVSNHPDIAAARLNVKK